MKKKISFLQVSIIALISATSAFAQVKPTKDSLTVPKNFENYNEFRVDKWGPVTYQGEGKCDILDLYQRSVEEGLGYSTIVDYHTKQIKENDHYSCMSWGLGLSFKVNPDSNKYSENYALRKNNHSAFSAQSYDAIKKLFASDSAFLEVESIMPVSFQIEGACFTVDFLFNKANEGSGFHGIIDIKANEAMIDGKEICTFWGLGVKYKHREVIEKVVTQKRVIEKIKVPAPKPDTVYIPAPSKPAKNCCIICGCEN